MDPNAIPTSALWYLSGTVGFRVDGPDGSHGVVHGIPRGGRPLRPLVLIVSDGTTVRFISLREIAAVSRARAQNRPSSTRGQQSPRRRGKPRDGSRRGGDDPVRRLRRRCLCRHRRSRAHPKEPWGAPERRGVSGTW